MATTQFEVYVLDDGRWTVHARYAAHERNEAVRDAGFTNSTLRLQTKVVRETYDPQSNATECVTIYTSPKSKPVGRIAAPPRQIRHAPSKPARRAARRLPRIAIQEVPRILLTASVSLFLAAVITFLMGRALQRYSVTDMVFSARTSSSLLSYFYIGAFLLFFMSLLRSRIRLQRLLSDLWAQTPARRGVGAGVPRRPHWAGPKQNRAYSPTTSKTSVDGDRQPDDVEFSIPVPDHSPREIASASSPPLQEIERLTVDSAPSVESQNAAEVVVPPPTLEPALPAVSVAVTSASESPPSIDMNVLAPIEVFLLMVFRPGSDPEKDSEVDQSRHDAIVRDALGGNGGTEVKRTDGGIFVRFSRADAALNAALEIQGKITRPVAIALIGNSDINEDPAFLPTVLRRAEAALQITANDMLTAEPAVHAAAALPHVRGELLTERQYEYGELLRLTHVAQPELPAGTGEHLGFGGFVREAVATIAFDQLNAYARFCFNLYLAGAASAVGHATVMAREDQLAMLSDALQVVGNSAERTETFCADLPGHGKNPRYVDMIHSGAQAMSEYISGGKNAVEGLAALLSRWTLPERRPSVPSLITFLFTDIVDSMEMTQDLGNAAAQRALRAHNAAVRAAMENGRGREVKHLGDGIMAVFRDPPSAVAAAIQTQHNIARHNTENPGLHISVRIGINLGEAVEEDNDFFGAAVQMTARICDTATRDNIWVSQGVVDACEGQQIVFIRRGHFEMKGVRDAKTLYEVGWTSVHKNEIGDL